MSGIFALLLSATAGGVTPPPVVSADSSYGAAAISVEPFG
jgi:hypothetical protein